LDFKISNSDLSSVITNNLSSAQPAGGFAGNDAHEKQNRAYQQTVFYRKNPLTVKIWINKQA